LVFVNAGENSIMADDAIMPSNPPFMSVKKKEFEEASLDMNVYKWLHKE